MATPTDLPVVNDDSVECPAISHPHEEAATRIAVESALEDTPPTDVAIVLVETVTRTMTTATEIVGGDAATETTTLREETHLEATVVDDREQVNRNSRSRSS